VWMETDVGFPGLGKVEGIRILAKVFRAPSAWRGDHRLVASLVTVVWLPVCFIHH
jgi:hypothetical protein